MSEFFAMGGYGVFIWPCYGLSALLIIGLASHRYKRVKKLRRLMMSNSKTEEQKE